MLIKLYQISKYPNSTALPDGNGLDVEGVIRSPSSIITPVIELQRIGQTSNYNFLYIPAWGRYYWIDNWTWDSGLWILSARCDVLASWRNEIGNATEYVVRSAAAFDNRVIDTTYPAKSQPVSATGSISGGFNWANSIQGGTYVVGNRVASTQFLVMSAGQLSSALDWAFSDEAIEEIVPGYVDSFPQLKAQYNPLQFIESITWFPFALPDSGAGSSPIRFGFAEHGSYSLIPADGRATMSTTITFPTHPQSEARGVWLNKSPYSEYVLFVPPWGAISIPPDKLPYNNTLNVRVSVDLRNGTGTLFLLDTLNQVFAQYEARVGVPTAYTQIVSAGVSVIDYLQSGVNVANALLSPSSGVNSLIGELSHVSDAAARQLPSASYLGSNGGFAAFSERPSVLGYFNELVDEDLPNRGRPLCSRRQISTLSGFIQVSNAEITTPGTEKENNEIRQLMNGGFYYE